MISAPSSLEQAKEEYSRIKADAVYFISEYIEVVHPIRGIVPFALYEFQKNIVDCLQEYRFNIIRKFRQAGITTISAAYSLWCILTKNDFSILVVSIGDRESQEFLKRVKEMYYRLPKWLKLKYSTLNKHEIAIIKTRSYIKAVPSASSAGRGLSMSLLIVDEAAFIEGMNEFWSAIYPTLSTGGAAFLISTVNGIGNFYYEKWMGAVEKRNEFNPIQINWEQHPEYNIPGWAEATRNNMSRKQWLQEYECEFLGTGDTFIDSDVLTRLRANICEWDYTRYNNRMRIFKEPHPHHEYLMGVDPSLGRGRDYSAFHIIDLYNGEQVAEFYSNKIPLNMFAKHIADEGRRYNTAYVVCERNGIGRPLIEQLYFSEQYENIWMDEKDFGIQVATSNRDQILGVLERSLREGWFRVKSERCVDELLTFIIDEKSGKIKADEGQHDDLVMSMALAAYAVEKLGGNVPLFAINDIENDDRFQVVSPVTTKDWNRPIYKGSEETKGEYISWLMS